MTKELGSPRELNPTFSRPADLPVEGAPVDQVPWAYAYRRDSNTNPPETQWLWASKRMERDGSVWTFHEVEGISRLCPREKVLCAFLWEEARQFNHIELEFKPADGALPQLDDLTVFSAGKGAIWGYDDANTLQYWPTLAPITTHAGATVYHFVIRWWGIPHFTGQKMYVVYRGSREDVAIPTVRAFGSAAWQKPLTVEIEWGFTSEHSALRNGRLEAYNGYIIKAGPLANGNGLHMTGQQAWNEQPTSGARRGLVVELEPVAEPTESRTVITLWSTAGDVSFAPRDLERGPILAPSLGIFITQAGSGLTARQYQAQLAAEGAQTVRQQVRQHAEYDLLAAVKAYNPGHDTLPDIPVPPYTAPMRIDTPEPLVNGQWNLGAWHLLRCNEKMPNGADCTSIFPLNYATFFSGGGAVAIGEESFQILRALDLMGQHDKAASGINYWLYGDHAANFMWYSELMGDGALCNSYSAPDGIAIGYDQKHYGGHANILQTAVLHYRLTADRSWLQQALPLLAKACQAIVKVRRAWMEQLGTDCWAYGLIPPGMGGDTHDLRSFYSASAKYYSALRDVAKLLAEEGWPGATEFLDEAELARQDLRRASDRSAALTPVVRVNDGTYRRYISWQPYMRGIGTDLPLGVDWMGAASALYFEGVMGGLRLVPLIYAPENPLAQEMLDVCEDLLLPQNALLKDKKETVTNWFLRWGPQGGHEPHHQAHLLADDIPLYLRSVFNAYASEVDPDNGYVLWELPLKGGCWEKQFETAAYLERIRQMLVMEEGDTLWLARATPRAWLRSGQHIAVQHAPTTFGETSYRITSNTAHNVINAEIVLPQRRRPKAICLRLRHPEQAKIRQMSVNGQSWSDFHTEQEVIHLPTLGDILHVRVEYGIDGSESGLSL
ncbi:MAG: hypothetical protein LLG44_14665 [Chloroflexi bacterium]|nr:hypothetical protein [Chloroflexota bacterium]